MKAAFRCHAASASSDKYKNGETNILLCPHRKKPRHRRIFYDWHDSATGLRPRLTR